MSLVVPPLYVPSPWHTVLNLWCYQPSIVLHAKTLLSMFHGRTSILILLSRHCCALR